MPWTFLLYGLVLPLSTAGLLVAVYANFKMQSLSAPTLFVPERAKAVAMQEIEGGRDWRYWRGVMWMGVTFVVAPVLLLFLILAFMSLSSGHRVSAFPPTIALTLVLVALPLIFANNRRRTQLLAQAPLATTPVTFSVEDMRKPQALKHTPEWRSASQDAWASAVLVLVGACVVGVTAFALLAGDGLAN